MAFVVKASVTLAPPSPFLVFADARQRLVDYGWPNDGIVIDSGPAGAITAPETRDVTFTLSGKPGASQDSAAHDVTDALANVSSGMHDFHVALDNTESAAIAAARAAGAAVGSAAGGALKGAGQSSGLGTGTLLGVGSITAVAIIGVAVLAFVFAAKRA